MGFDSLGIDETTILLIFVCFGLFLCYQLYAYIPDVHYLFLSSQALTSSTRLINESSIYRHKSTPFNSNLAKYLRHDVTTCYQLMSKALKKHSNIVGYSPNNSDLTWINGNELQRQISKFALGLLSHLKEAHSDTVLRDKNSRFIILCDESSMDLLIIMLAGILFNFKLEFVSPSIFKSRKLLSIFLKETISANQRTVLFCSQIQFSKLLPAINDTSLSVYTMLVLLEASSLQSDSIAIDNPNVKAFKEIGSGTQNNISLFPPTENNEVLYQFWGLDLENNFQTVEFLDSQVMASVTGISNIFPQQFSLSEQDVYYSPRSITSTSEFSTLLYMFYSGVPVGLGLSAAIFQPTVTFIPALELLDLLQIWGLGVGAEKIGEELIGSAYESPPPMGFIKRWFLHYQLRILKQYRCLSNSFLAFLIFKKERAALGGQVRLIFISNPYVPILHRNALRVVLGSQIITTLPLSPYSPGATCANYGWAAVGTFFDYMPDPSLPLIGGPSPSVEFKISLVSEDALSEGDDPVGYIHVAGNSLSSFKGAHDSSMIHSDKWMSTGLLGRVNATSSLAVLTSKVFEPLAVSPSWVGLHWLETWVSAHDPYVHCLRLELLGSASAKPLRFGGLVILRLEPVLKFAQNRDLKLDLEQLACSPRLKAQVLQGIQAELAAAASSEREYLEGVSPGMPGPFPEIELDIHQFRLMMKSKYDHIQDPETWE